MPGHETSEQDKPWYRHPMVWFIIALPASVVIASIITINIAYKNKPQIVELRTQSNVQSSTNQKPNSISGQSSDQEQR